MSELQQAAQQALELMQKNQHAVADRAAHRDVMAFNAAIIALRAALAEPVQEPYCYVYEYDSVFGLHREFYPRPYNGTNPSRTVPVYAHPPQRKPLTPQQATDLVQSVVSNSDRPIGMVAYGLLVVRALERAHGIGGEA